MLMGLRLGNDPKAALSTTPKRIAELRELVKRGVDEYDPAVVISRASTMANAANLSAVFLDTVISQYEGTRLYDQEILGVLLDDDEDMLWTDRTIALAHRFHDRPHVVPERVNKVVGVDPPTSLTRDECGIVAAALLAAPLPGISLKCAAILADRSLKGSPERWGRAVVDLCREIGTNVVVAERNQGGEMVRSVIQNADDSDTIRVELVWAGDSKRLRAEPASQLYEQQRVIHMDRFVTLEDQQTTWTPGEQDSPDRVDALVHAIAHLLPELNQRPSAIVSPANRRILRGREALERAVTNQDRPATPYTRMRGEFTR